MRTVTTAWREGIHSGQTVEVESADLWVGWVLDVEESRGWRGRFLARVLG